MAIRRSPAVILKGEQVSLSGNEVLVRPPRGLPDGPRVLVRTEPDGQPVLDVTCTCGRRFDVLLEQEVER